MNLTHYSGYWCSKSSHKTFSITYTELYVLVVTLSTQDNVKMFEQLIIFLKKGQLTGININQKKSIERPNQYLDYLIGPCFQRVNILFVLSFENEA